ncbi:adenylyltransferase/cytidyltransferase family protein [Halorussus amylolyticus]|uniref:adenylyltransferase/cytidyltransferase family protein n=1 Tax=Halorussus amylolyticus TaxID=1126242 RepID=UPI00104766F6|nr:adenylyltransferase/cytidyltransferase family protein [Halorussus amylolyticus]
MNHEDTTTHVVAQGTFDLLHPGHVHYLRDAAAMGDRLTVIVARRENVTHKQPPILPNRQRRDVVAALDAVDDARVGHPEDIFAPIEELRPDIIALGYDQHHDEAAIEDELARRGVECSVRRASPRDPEYDGELLSSGRIIDRILEERA